MIIRVRSNVGTVKVNLDDVGAPPTVNSLVRAVAGQYGLSYGTVSLAFDLEGTRMITTGTLEDTLSLRNINHGELIYLVDLKIEREVVAKSSVDAAGNVRAAGTHFAAVAQTQGGMHNISSTSSDLENATNQRWPEAAVPSARSPLVSNAVPVAALKRDGEIRVAEGGIPGLGRGPGAVPHPNVLTAVAPTFAADYTNEDGYRRPDAVKRERLVGGSPTSPLPTWAGDFPFARDRVGLGSFGELRDWMGEAGSGILLGTSAPPVHEFSSSSVFGSGSGAGSLIDSDTLAAARAAGVSEAEIGRLVQTTVDEALARQQQIEHESERKEAASLAAFRQSTKLQAEGAEKLMAEIEARLEMYKGANPKAASSGVGYVPTAVERGIVDVGGGGLSPYESHLRRIRDKKPGAKIVSSPPTGGINRRSGVGLGGGGASSEASGGQSPRYMSLQQLNRELSFEIDSDSAPPVTIPRPSSAKSKDRSNSSPPSSSRTRPTPSVIVAALGGKSNSTTLSARRQRLGIESLASSGAAASRSGLGSGSAASASNHPPRAGEMDQRPWSSLDRTGTSSDTNTTTSAGARATALASAATAAAVASTIGTQHSQSQWRWQSQLQNQDEGWGVYRGAGQRQDRLDSRSGSHSVLEDLDEDEALALAIRNSLR